MLLVPHMGIGQSRAQRGFKVTLSPRRSGLFLAGALHTSCSSRPFLAVEGVCEDQLAELGTPSPTGGVL